MLTDTKERRKSLIPIPCHFSRKQSPVSTPLASPSKSKSTPSNVELTSPSKLPVSKSKKRSVSSLDSYINSLQTHISQDIHTENASLTSLISEIDNRLSHYHQLCTKLRDLQKQETRLNDILFEYEIGIPVKEAILKQESYNAETEVSELESKIELEKRTLSNTLKLKEEKLLNDLKELVTDAEQDDEETIKIRETKMEAITSEKNILMRKIDTAKREMDLVLESFKTSFENKRQNLQNELNSKHEVVTGELLLLKEKHALLTSQHGEIKLKIKTATQDIGNSESEISKTKHRIQALKYRISDVESLIQHLQKDLQDASQLCCEFENGVYLKSKSEWMKSKSRLQTEKYKRLKIEMQIREFSGIPHLIILRNGNNLAFNDSSLSEFVKDTNYDWRLDLTATLEYSLQGNSLCLVNCDENLEPNDTKLAKEILDKLKHISEQERFSSFESTFRLLDGDALEHILAHRLELPDCTVPVHVEMRNRLSQASRQAIIFVLNIEKSTKLHNLADVCNRLPWLLVANNVTDPWLSDLATVSTIKSIRLNQSYSFLNN